MPEKNNKTLSPGNVVFTPGTIDVILSNDKTPLEFLSRHLGGDWGCVAEEEKLNNDLAIESGERIISVYVLPNNNKIWIITEAEVEHVRHTTTILLQH